MPSYLEGDINSPTVPSIGGVTRSERVWRHRYDIEVKMQKPRRTWRSLLAIGAGGVVLSTVLMFGYGDIVSTHKRIFTDAEASIPVPEEPTTRLTDVVERAPAPGRVSGNDTQAASLAYTVTPTKRPDFQVGKSGGPLNSINASSATGLANTVHFDKCKPTCETRDPLIVGAVPPRSPTLASEGFAEASSPESPSRALEVGEAALNGARLVLFQTAVLPFTTVKFGHDAVMAFAQSD